MTTRTSRISISEGSQSLDTICGVHRRMYQILSARDPSDEVIPLLRKSFVMAKKMNARLRKYKNGYDDSWYEMHRLDGGAIESTETQNQGET